MSNIGAPAQSQSKLTRLLDSPPAEVITLLLYGASKAGKTHLIGTLGSRVLYICFTDANGSETLRNKEFFPNLNPIYKVIPQDDKAYDRVLGTIDEALDNYSEEFDTIVVDEMTAFRRAGMRKSIELNLEEKRSQTKTKSDRRDGIIIPTISDFGTEMNLTDHFISETIGICQHEKKNFVAVAHESLIYKKDPNTPLNAPETLVKIRPSFTGKKAPDDIVAYFDAVLYIEVVNGNVHRLRCVGDDVLVAGHRYGNTLKSMEMNPNLSEIFKRVKSR